MSAYVLRADVDAVVLSATGLLVAAGLVLGVWTRLRVTT
jgi:hypothetical protein